MDHKRATLQKLISGDVPYLHWFLSTSNVLESSAPQHKDGERDAMEKSTLLQRIIFKWKLFVSLLVRLHELQGYTC